MSATTIVTTFSDLYSALLSDMRSGSGVSTTTQLAQRYIDTGHKELYVGNGERFHWAERRAFIKTHAEYNDGTIAATQGSATITGTDTLWNTLNTHGQLNLRVGGKITIGSGNVIYEVLTVASDTSATISPEFIGDTDTGLDYRYFEDEYALAADFLKPVDQRSFDDARKIYLIGRSDFRRMYPRNWIPTVSVRNAIVIDRPPVGNTVPIRKIQFGPPPSNTQVIPYSYVTSYIVTSSIGAAKATFTADSDEPTMPLLYRNAILMAAKVAWYRDIKDDARSAQVFQEMSMMLDRVLGDQDLGAQRLRVVSPRAMYEARARYPYRRGGRHYDLNGAFDRFDDRD